MVFNTLYLRSLIGSLLIVASLIAEAQSFRISRLDESDGLFERFIYSTDQDHQGYIILGTSNGMYRYDGFVFEHFGVKDGLSHPFITTSAASEDDLYFGHGDGSVSVYRNARVQTLYRDSLFSQRVISMSATTEGLWSLQQGNKLLLWKDNELQLHQLQMEGAMARSIHCTAEGKVIVACDMGVYLYDADKNNAKLLDSTAGLSVTAFCHAEGSDREFFMAAEDLGIVKLNLEKETIRFLNGPGQPDSWLINDMRSLPGNKLCLATNSHGMLMLEGLRGERWQQVTTPAGLNRDVSSIRTIQIDREQNLWLGTNGEGLIMLSSQAFTIHRFRDEEDCKVTALNRIHDRLWIGTSCGLLKASGNLDTLAHWDWGEGIPTSKITDIERDEQGRIWLSTARKGLYFLEPEAKNFIKFELPGDLLNERINDLLYSEGLLYVATDYGLYQVREKQVLSHLTMLSGLPHNVVNTLFKDSFDRVWIGTYNSGLTYIEEGVILNTRLPMDKLLDTYAFTQDKSGSVWAGTDGAGVVCVSERDTAIYNRMSGLYSDYCYGIQQDRAGRIWIAHRNGLSQIDPVTGDVEVYDESELTQSTLSPNAFVQGPFGNLMVGIDKGLLLYNADLAKPMEVEPSVNLKHVVISDSLFATDKTIDLPYGMYRIEFGFVGLSFRNPEQVTYRYFLEGYDLEWSDRVSDNTVRYSRLDPGSYTFKVKAYNKQGVGGSEEAEVRINILRPYWEQWWFYAVIIFVIFLVVRFIIRRREYVMRMNQERLQQELDLRTREVVAQKELIERRNKDITDSIRYAKNIQKAMLPAPDILNRHFAEAFVYFKPRDIVSGDFYWTEKFGSKILVACADCTGHGVPGAFMSLIGTVLLKDTSRNRQVESPSELLYALEHELNAMLHQGDGPFSVQDGMDISVVEYDFETSVLRCSSARRPVVVYQSGRRIEIKGDRNSIGGQMLGESKQFTLNEIQLRPGDSFYQFSDGISDQFGGNDGKKLKKKGLLSILDQAKTLPMNEQYTHIRRSLKEWKGDEPQVDDIILLGIRV